MSESPASAPQNRRAFLKKSAKVSAGLCAGAAALEGCGLLPEPEMRICTLAELETVPYLISRFNGKQIFVTHLDGELVIFSLICRHRRCTVEYDERDDIFVCPCHDGLYDAYGQVLDGPPPGPLRRYRPEIRGEEVWVINEYVKDEKPAEGQAEEGPSR
ncbi:MAG: Rieske (2Fe-2S) protein [Bacteroidetes bacterium]|nr:MAG: Rieske (2Fe-2S) protein [Bacteroidota bacterium]